MLVKIPETRNPFIVALNGVEYVYQAGEEVEVPDAIGELILNAVKAADNLTETDEVEPPFGSGDCSCEGGVTSWNDLPDKPFGEETVEKVILDNVSTSGGPANDVEEGYGDEHGVLRASEMVPGDTYIAIVDGIEYRDVCREVADETSDGGVGVEVFPAFASEEIPVSLGSYGNNVYISFYPNDMQSRTVTLIHLAKEVTTLDPKFLPKADAVADVSAAPTAEEFNALLAALREAGYLAE